MDVSSDKESLNGASLTEVICLGICNLHAVTVPTSDTASIMLRLAFNTMRSCYLLFEGIGNFLFAAKLLGAAAL